MTIIRTFIAFLAIACSFPALAGPSGDAAKSCFADSTNGKDRKALARWIFLGMAAHPEIRTLSRATSDDADQSSKAVGSLFTRLLTENCSGEVRAMVKNEGSESLRSAFEFLGALAMQELSTNPEVKTALMSFERFVDRSKVAAVLDSK
jgi:hypothetical protein